MEEVGEGGHDRLLSEGHEVAHLYVNPRAEAELVAPGVEDLAEAPTARIDGVRLQGDRELGSDKTGEHGHGALGSVGGGEAEDGVGNAVLDVGGLLDVLSGQKIEYELRAPDALRALVDVGERLEGHRRGFVAGLVVGATDGQGGGARAAILIEDQDPGLRVALPLQGQQGKEGALAGAGRTDEEGVADVPDEEIQPEGRVAARAAVDVGGPDAAHLAEVGALAVAGPDGRDGHQLREIDRVDDRTSDVRVDVAGMTAEPGVA